MQDPERFLDEGTEFERALLRGGAAERPSARAVRRMALGAGVGGALSYTSSAQALIETWWGKAAAAVVGGGAIAGVAYVVAPDTPSERVPAALDDAALAAPAQAPQAPPLEPTPSEPARKRVPAAAPALPVEAGPAKRPLRAPKTASTLSDEIKLLDRARNLMARGDRALALAELDGYDRRYPEGTLRHEASVLRARATGP